MGMRLSSLPAHLQAAITKELEKQGQTVTAPARSKYGAVRTELDGITYDSGGEAGRSAVLAQMLRAGLIRNLRPQVKYPLHVATTTLGCYVADFVYEEQDAAGQWVEVVEDFKGVRTPIYRWKAKHMLAEYGITIRETGTRKAAKKRKAKSHG